MKKGSPNKKYTLFDLLKIIIDKRKPKHDL